MHAHPLPLVALQPSEVPLPGGDAAPPPPPGAAPAAASAGAGAAALPAGSRGLFAGRAFGPGAVARVCGGGKRKKSRP